MHKGTSSMCKCVSCIGVCREVLVTEDEGSEGQFTLSPLIRHQSLG